MFVEDAFCRPADIETVSGTYFYKAGDLVLMLIGDTLLPAVVEGVCQLAGASKNKWSVMWTGAGRVYHIPESFLRPYVMLPA